MSWRSLIGISALVCLASPVSAASDINRFIGQQVVEIEFVSNGVQIRDSAVFDLIETAVGEPLRISEVRESLTHLFSLGRYGGISVNAHERDGGVALSYQLQVFSVIDRVELIGNTELSNEELSREVVRNHGEIFSENVVSEVVETVRNYYARRGYFDAVIEADIRRTPRVNTLRIAVSAGARIRVNRWLITGVASASLNSRLRERLSLQDGDFYDGLVLDQRLNEYETELRSLRYYEARLSHSIERRDGTASIDVRLSVYRGPRINVIFDGDEVPNATVEDLVPVAREASVDEDLLEDADLLIVNYLRSLGYRDAEVTHTRNGADDEISIVFSVHRGPLYRVADVLIQGNENVSADILLGLIDLPAGEPFVDDNLDAGLATIEELYQRRGFTTVRAASSRVDAVSVSEPVFGEVWQTVNLIVEEGPRMTVGSVVFEGVQAWPVEQLHETVTATVGGAFYGLQIIDDRDVLLRRYLNDGYEQVAIDVDTSFSDDLTEADVTFRITEGYQVIVDHVLIVGNEQVDAETIRQELTLVSGSALGLDDVAETRRRLNALGMFRRLDIREFSHGQVERRDLIIEVEEAPATTLAYGGGLEASQRLRRAASSTGGSAVERIEFAPRGSLQIGRRNLWGKNRSINLFTRVSVRRKNDLVSSNVSESSQTLGFNEYRVLATYREPRSFSFGWDVLVSSYVEQTIRPGFDLFSRGVTAQMIANSGDAATTTVGYRLGANDTSNRQLNLEDSNIVDRLFPEVRLSSFRVSRLRDTRDDPFDPSRGTAIVMETELASRAIGSAIGFSKSFVSGSIFKELGQSSRVVFAAGSRLGLAWGFPQTLPLDVEGASVKMRRTLALPLSERFFAGGDTTVRGYALDRLGEPSRNPGGTIDQDGFPQGGNAMIIVNTELRVRLTGTLGLVTFLDAGNVYAEVQRLSLRRLRSGAGFGIRYSSPVGPIRVDLGFKLGERYFFGDETSRTQEPLTALHISIGQAF